MKGLSIEKEHRLWQRKKTKMKELKKRIENDRVKYRKGTQRRWENAKMKELGKGTR